MPMAFWRWKISDCAFADRGVERSLVAGVASLDHGVAVAGVWQPAGVGGEDAVCAALHVLPLTGCAGVRWLIAHSTPIQLQHPFFCRPSFDN